MSNVTAGVVPPPGAGFVTETTIDPTAFSCDAGMTTVSEVPETAEGESWSVPKFTVDDGLKLLPFSVNVRSDWRTVTSLGWMLISTGDSFSTLTETT